MKKLIAATLLIAVFFLANGALANLEAPINLPIKQLYSAPSDLSDVVFEIPIAVSLLDISNDGNWYKVNICYNFGPFSFDYVGWTEIPVSEIIEKRLLAEMADEELELNLPIKKFYSEPSEISNLILDIPVEVALVDIAVDGNWYKVSLSYSVGPFSFAAEGWANIPAGEILAERAFEKMIIACVN